MSPDPSITLILELTVQPGKFGQAQSVLEAMVPATRDFDGCRGVSVHTAQSDPDRFLLIERWVDAGAHQRYLAWRKENGGLAPLAEVLAAPPNMQTFTDLDEPTRS